MIGEGLFVVCLVVECIYLLLSHWAVRSIIGGVLNDIIAIL